MCFVNILEKYNGSLYPTVLEISFIDLFVLFSREQAFCSLNNVMYFDSGICSAAVNNLDKYFSFMFRCREISITERVGVL